MVKEYYNTLEINEGANLEEIKKAYRKLALKWHPDKNKNSEESKKKMQEIGEAYEKLNDEGIRKVEYNSNYYDYEIPTDGSLVKETLKDLDDSYYVLRTFYVGEYDDKTGTHKRAGETVVNDYDMERVKRLLELLNTVSETNKEGREFENIYGNSWKSARFAYIIGLKEEAWRRGQGHLFGWFSGTSSWEGNVNQIKNALNYCRKAMGLSELADQDFRSIKGNNQNESPQIPGPGKPQEIEGGKFDDYNKLYSGKTHEVHREFEVVWQKVFGQFYSNGGKEWNQVGYDKLAKLPSFSKVQEKLIEAEKGAVQFIPNNADVDLENRIKADNEKDLNKKKVAIKWAKKLLAESENDNSNVDKNQSNNVTSGSEGKKRKAEIDFVEESRKRSKTVANGLDQLIQEAQEINTYAELEAKIKEIDKYQEEEIYQGKYQEAIKQLKINLANLDEEKYWVTVVEGIQIKLKESGINENDLDEETRNELTKIKKGEVKDINIINKVENKVTSKAGEKKAENSLSKWLDKARKLVEGITKGTTSHLEEQLREIQKNLYSFRHGTNVYQNLVYKNRENDVKAMLSKLDSYSVSSQAIQPKSSFFQAKYIIPASLLTVGLIIIAIIVVRNKKRSKVKR